MLKTRSSHLLTDRPLKNSRYSFGEGPMDFLTDKKGVGGGERERETWGFGTLEGKYEGVCKTYEAMFKGKESVRNKGGNRETLFYCEVDQALAQVAHGGCGVLEDIKNLSGYGLGQMALYDPCWAGRVAPDDLQRSSSLNHSVIKWVGAQHQLLEQVGGSLISSHRGMNGVSPEN